MSGGDAANHPTPALAAHAPTEVAIVTAHRSRRALGVEGLGEERAVADEEEVPGLRDAAGQPGDEDASFGGPVEGRDVGAVDRLAPPTALKRM